MLAYLENRLEMHESDLIDFLIWGDNPDNTQDYTLIGPSITVIVLYFRNTFIETVWKYSMNWNNSFFS